MASNFLLVFFNNLPRFIRSHHIWTLVWAGSLLVLSPKVLTTKLMTLIWIYGIFLFFMITFIWSSADPWNQNALINEFYQIAVGASIISYFRTSGDYVGLAKITKWSIVFLMITGIMTIISSSIDPMYARNIIGLATEINQVEIDRILSFRKYGGGTYATAIAVMTLVPSLTYLFKYKSQDFYSKKMITAAYVIFLLALLGMQLFANIIVGFAVMVVAFLGVKRLNRSLLLVGIMLIILAVIPRETYVNVLKSTANLFDKGSELRFKFNDMAEFINEDMSLETQNSGTAKRVQRYPMLFNAFIKEPFWGVFYNAEGTSSGYQGVGGHLYWMNKLTTTGLIGFIIFLLIPIQQIKSSYRFFDETYRFYYFLAFFATFSYGLLKALAGRDPWYIFFVILPGIYYLPLLNKKNKIKKHELCK